MESASAAVFQYGVVEVAPNPSALTSVVSPPLRMRSSHAVRTPKAVLRAKFALLMASGSPSSPGAYT